MRKLIHITDLYHPHEDPDDHFDLAQIFALAKNRTVRYIFNKNERIMAYVITDDCVMCGTCAGECPSEAISEGDGKYVIDANACVDCGTCADACPTGAITPGE